MDDVGCPLHPSRTARVVYTNTLIHNHTDVPALDAHKRMRV